MNFDPQILPSLNALLNTLCTFCLLGAFIAMKTHRLTIHRNLMLLAVGISVVFLISYLTYHFAYATHTRYPGPYRLLYLIILITHEILAVTLLFLVPVTLGKALKAQKGNPRLDAPDTLHRFTSHRRLARWTFPIWLYVSITGVVIYLMRYHLADR